MEISREKLALDWSAPILEKRTQFIVTYAVVTDYWIY
jgi:hypothetical protein